MQTVVESRNKLEAAIEYAQKGWPVFPVRANDKKPLIKDWYNAATVDIDQISAWWGQDRWPTANIGIVMGPRSGLVTLDIDTKKGKRGDQSLEELELEHGPLPETLKSETTSGGWHYVFRLPETGVESRIGVVEGIDLLSTDKFIVAPPSEVNGRAYRWLNECEPAACPEWVVQLGNNRRTSDANADDKIAEIVRSLFPNGKESNGYWVALCPYHDDRDPSLSVTLRTGNFRCFSPCGKRGNIVELYSKVRGVSQEEADRMISPPPPHIEELNQKHAVILDLGGKCMVLNEARHPKRNSKLITYSSTHDLAFRYRNRRVFVDWQKKPVSIAEDWFSHRFRRQYEGVVFLPGQSTATHYNLWQGFAVTPKEGDCGLYLQHIYDNICQRDGGLYRYVMCWMAQIVQQPSERPGTALVLRGKEGVGKGVFCTWFGKLFAPHFKPVWTTSQVVGRFNAHFATAIVVFADEAIWAGDKSGDGMLKAVITEELMPIEYKGKDIVHVDNYVRLMMATNNDWAVPAGFDARRFCMIDVSDAQMRRDEYFKPIEDQMKNGGHEALLYMLQNYDISGINLRKVPETEALTEMKLRGMGIATEFYFSILSRGTFRKFDSEWKPRIVKSDLHDQFVEYSKAVGISRRSTETQLGMTIRKLCPHIDECNISDPGIGIRKGWDFGDLQRCRDAFAHIINRPNYKWDTAGNAPL